MKCFYGIYFNLFFIVLVTGGEEESEANGTEYAQKGSFFVFSVTAVCFPRQ
jgi:hypothetical protein